MLGGSYEVAEYMGYKNVGVEGVLQWYLWNTADNEWSYVTVYYRASSGNTRSNRVMVSGRTDFYCQDDDELLHYFFDDCTNDLSGCIEEKRDMDFNHWYEHECCDPCGDAGVWCHPDDICPYNYVYEEKDTYDTSDVGDSYQVWGKIDGGNNHEVHIYLVDKRNPDYPWQISTCGTC